MTAYQSKDMTSDIWWLSSWKGSSHGLGFRGGKAPLLVISTTSAQGPYSMSIAHMALQDASAETMVLPVSTPKLTRDPDYH